MGMMWSSRVLEGTRRAGQLCLAGGLLLFAFPAFAQSVQGSGSTFAFPVITAWAEAYRAERAGDGGLLVDDSGLDYEAVGSLAGVMRLSSSPDIDFAATDAPLSAAEVEKRGLVQFPLVMGGIAAVVNLPGVEPGALKLSGPLLADIYLGRVSRWNDAALAALNPGLSLPDLPISPVHRADGSGSTLAWTSFLAAEHPEWQARFGADTLVAWPVGRSVEGSRGVIDAVRAVSGSVGYVEFGQAQRAGLSFASVRNRAGRFVAPDRQSIEATAADAPWKEEENFFVRLTDAPAPDAYPLSAVTFALMRARGHSEARTRRTLFVLSFGLRHGAEIAAELGYAPLPASLVERIERHWAEKLPGAAGL